MGDVIVCWWVILLCALLAFVLGLLHLCLIRLLAKIMVWVTIISVFLLLIVMGTICWFFKNRYESHDKSYSFFKWIAVVFWILSGLYLLLVLCCCRAI